MKFGRVAIDASAHRGPRFAGGLLLLCYPTPMASPIHALYSDTSLDELERRASDPAACAELGAALEITTSEAQDVMHLVYRGRRAGAGLDTRGQDGQGRQGGAGGKPIPLILWMAAQPGGLRAACASMGMTVVDPLLYGFRAG